jgi:hypothetical protein
MTALNPFKLLGPNPIQDTIHTLLNNIFPCLGNFTGRDKVHMKAMLQGKFKKNAPYKRTKIHVQAARDKHLTCQFS